MKDIIKLENVKKIYAQGQRAVNDVSFSIGEKEHVVFHGAPGSGKSTLMRLIAGMEKPSDGKIFVIDKAVHKMNSDEASNFRNLNFGVLQRDPCFMGNINLLENIALPLTIRGINAAKRTLEAKRLLKGFGLLYAAGAYPDQVSTYEAHLASIARALISLPKVLLLDEITAGLSLKDSEQVLSKINDISKSGDYVIISFSGTKNCVLHADRYFTLDHGSIQEDIT